MPIRVVIVDDTDSLRELMGDHVQRHDRMELVGEAVDGLQAVSVVGETQPDAVILDVEMPVMDGLQALPALRQAAPAAKIVVFSSRMERVTEEAARRGGAHGFFLKGRSTSDEVVAYVARLFADRDSPSAPLP